MKTKKFILAATSILAIAGLAGCSNGTEGDLVDMNYKLGKPGTLAEGFTDLANKNANGAVKDGYYEAGGQQFKVKDTYKTTYATEPDDAFFNYLINTWTYNSYHYCNMVDGLVENDKYGNIVGAIALGYKTAINEDGTQTWTFQLRENAEWVNNETGKKVANVTANDFVSGAKYVLNPANASGTTSLLTQWIKGAAEYSAALGKNQSDPNANPAPDFKDVGVKAVSDYVLEYTLIEPTPYFLSVLTYSPYLPVYEAFVEEEGTDFGKTVNDILVNGSFRITEHTFQDKMIYAKNYHYYDRDHVYVKHVERKFVQPEATIDTTRTWFEAGLIDGFTVQQDDEEGWKSYVEGADGTGTLKAPAAANCNAVQSYGDATYVGYFNFNRTFYEYEGGITKTADQKKDTAKAVLNKNFRNGFLWGMDVIQYLKRFSKTEPQNYLMRGFTNKELDSANGKDYTDYVNAEFNKNQGTKDVSLVGIDNGSDPVYNPTKAAAAFALAKTELEAAGCTMPIYVDYIGSMNAQLQPYEKAMIKSLEDSAKGVVKINYNVPKDATQNTNWGSVKDNFDFSMWSGWGPDYADPNTYLHCYCIYGDMLKHNGLPTDPTQLGAKELGEFLPKKYQDLVETSGGKKDYSKAIKALQEDALGAYDKEYRDAAAIVDPSKKVERFEAFAKAEYKLIFEESIVIPWYSQNGYYAQVSRTVPWQAGRATYGLTSDKFKNVIVTEEAITKEQRKAVTDAYDAGK